MAKKNLLRKLAVPVLVAATAVGCVSQRDVRQLNEQIWEVIQRGDRKYEALFVFSQNVFPANYDVDPSEIYRIANSIVYARKGHAMRTPSGEIMQHLIGLKGPLEYETAQVIKQIAGDDALVTAEELKLAKKRIPLEYKKGDY